jgi:hypothetical protein
MLVLAAVLTGVLAMHTAGHAAGTGGHLTATHSTADPDMGAMSAAAMPGMDPGGTAAYGPAHAGAAPAVASSDGSASHGEHACTLATMCVALLSAASAAALVRARGRAAPVVDGSADPARARPAGALSWPRPPRLAVLSVCRT